MRLLFDVSTTPSSASTDFYSNSYWKDWREATHVCDFEIERMLSEAMESCLKDIANDHYPAWGQVATGDAVVQVVCWKKDTSFYVQIMKPQYTKHVSFEEAIKGCNND